MDENSIEEKKKEFEQKNVTDSLLSLFKSLLSFGIIIIIGSLTLYSVRASQTGLVPTNTECNPYTDLNGTLKGINVNINVVKKGEDVYASRLNFPIEENLQQMSKGFLGFLKKLIHGDKASTYTLYIGKIIEKVVATNFAFMNTIYNLLNTYFPESFIIFLGPIIMFFIQIVTLFINMVNITYRFFYDIYLLFSTRKTENGKSKWEEHSIFDVFNLGWTVLYYFIFFLLFCFGGLFFIPSLAIFISLYCLFFPLFLQSNIVKESGDKTTNMKKFGLKQAILDTFTFKKSIILYMLTVIIISGISSAFSTYVIVGFILGFLILYFFTDIYKQYLPKSNDYSSNGFASFEPVKIETATVQKEQLTTFQTILKKIL